MPYFDWSIIEAGLIIITGSMPFLRPLLATVLPSFFKARNFTSLFPSGKSGTGGEESGIGLPSLYASGASNGGGSGSAPGDVTITNEFHLMEAEGASPCGQGAGGGGGFAFDSRPPGTPSTPLAPKYGFQRMVTCEKGGV